MARSRASHAAWRELIAARLDRPLTRAETRSLAAHLRDCAACHQVDRDYREQRALLRALPRRPVPRDLWPRTSAALDREVARGSYRAGRPWRGRSRGGRLPDTPRRASVPSAPLVTTLAALGVIAALGVTQLLPTLEPAPPPAVPGLATPFEIAPQPLTFIGNEATDLYVYQTDVSQACPAAAPDCAVRDSIVRTEVNLPARVHARNVARSPNGSALVLVGRASNRDLIAVVMLEGTGGDQPGSHGGSGPTPPAMSGGSTTPDGSGRPPGSDQAPATPVSGQPATATPLASTMPGLRAVAILENVVSAGAPPAWSQSGEMLAFSAMPADGSHGPDVYVWSPSDAVARPITRDHGSYFASWSGQRIVASRAAAKPGAAQEGFSTVVIDPASAEERAVDGPALWLPVVDPARRLAVGWRGELHLANGLAVPHTGTLYMVDWAAIDPFAPSREPLSTPTASVEPQASPQRPSETRSPPSAAPATAAASATATAAASATATAAASATATATGTAFAATPSTASPSPTVAVTPTPTQTAVSPEVTEQPTAPLPAGSVALDLGRDTISAPVVDWQVRWSVDGQVLGIWIADAADSTWGRLTVLAVEPSTHVLGTDDPLLSPTLARRGFSLGMSRVAWVAPSVDDPEGELRIRTWGDDGVGGLRLPPSKLERVLPAF